MTNEIYCNHTFIFMGVVFYYGDPVPGSGARYRFLEDKFFCQKCLKTVYQNRREHGHSYHKDIPGTIPKGD